MKTSTPLAWLVVTTLLASCSDPRDPDQESQNPSENDSPVVLTTFYPTHYFTQRIAQGAVDVACPLPPDADPIFWMPDADAIQQYQAADLIVVNGAGFEKWVDKVNLPTGDIVDTMKPYESELVRYENAITHKHGPEGEHSHEGIDGHTWVDPVNAIRQAKEIEKAMAERWPTHADTFSEGFALLEKDLQALDTRLGAFAGSWGDRKFLASHPAYNYVVKRYGIAIINLDLDPETVPDEASLDGIRETMAENEVRHLLWESAPAAEVAAAMENLGLENVLFSPCETAPETGDYLTVMRQNVDRLEALAGREG